MATDLSLINDDNYNEYIDQLTPEEVKELSARMNAPAKPVEAPVKKEPPKTFGEAMDISRKERGIQDTSYGMGHGELALAGAGKFADDILSGIANKVDAVGSMYQDPKTAAATIAAINARKAEKQSIDQQLMQNPAAIVGNIAPNAAAGALTAPRIGAQMMTQGAMGLAPSPTNPVQGPLSEMLGSGLHAANEAAGTYLGGKAFQAAGKAVNAARGNYTPVGTDAMVYDAATKRLGLPANNLGDLAPLGVPGQLNRLATDYPQRIQESGDALRNVLSSTSKAGLKVPMGEYTGELENAARERFQQAKQMYGNVDNFVKTNGLTGIQPSETYTALDTIARKFTPKGKSFEDNPVLEGLLRYDPHAFDWLRNLGPNAGQRTLKAANNTIGNTIQQGVDVSTYHDMRVAANKMWTVLNRKLARDPTDHATVEAFKDINRLRDALDKDADKWAGATLKNKEAMDQYKQAKAFYKDVVTPSVIENPVARKLLSRTNPYPTGVQALNATTNTAGMEGVDLLRPTLSARGEDMVRATRGPLPHSPNPVTDYVRSGRLPNSTSGSGLVEAAGMATPGLGGVMARSPLRTIGTVLGNLTGATKADTLKRLYFAREPQGLGARLGYGAMQYPDEKVQQGLDVLTGQRKP